MNETALEVRAISKRFGSIVAVDRLSLEIRHGEVFGFVGSNGAGKTTTMRIVLGTLACDGGDVLWAGARMTFDIRRRIGYMPEERGLYPKMRVGEQLLYFAQLHGLGAVEAARSVERWLERFGLKDRIGDEVQKLSHGNQQRAQLAAALVFNPIMLVLDEPFAGLDPEAVDSMSEVLHECAGAGTPVIFSSHQLELVERICDRVGIIQRGRLVACGTIDELRQGPPQWWVDAPGAPSGWSGSLPGVHPVRQDGSRLLLQLDDGMDEQGLLKAALAAAPVREFRRNVPTLLDVFREAMTEDGAVRHA